MEENRELFRNEIKILDILKERINKSYVINLIEFGDADFKIENNISTHNYIILEYADKGNLSDYICNYKSVLSEIHCKLIFYKILKEIKALHNAKIYHLDIKLSNILLDGNFNPKISDFGYSEYDKINIKKRVGTRGYRAPETYKKNKNYDGVKADTFSLGVALFRLITKKPGFRSSNKDEALDIYENGDTINLYKLDILCYLIIFHKREMEIRKK